ncbi:hypothetical protein CVT24_010803 [Panaeolus cyanescens]|uniref:Uncharacterized protein n=1 Tax=Panaeolus cyanescens TaxID=181874 RepID=A0A409VGX4_9AGAR|nr:hypothetical protein CVT24_010803 [Panaeolus cyanescens]
MSFPSMVYLVLTILMWCVATMHLGLSIERLLRVFIIELEAGSPSTFVRLMDATKWDTAAHMSLVASMVWLGDILVVYRTYIVWNRNFYVIILPLLLDSVNLVLNIMCMYWYTHPHVIAPEKASPWFLAIFPLVFAQNVLTTGLLSYKIWAQHRKSLAHGIINTGGGHTLGWIACIMIEAAMLYTIELLIVIILNSLNHPATGMVVICMVPTIGIVFVLMAVRIHFGGNSSSNTRNDTANNRSTWIRNSNGDIELARTESATTSGRVDLAFRIPDPKCPLHLDHSGSDDHDEFPTCSFSRKPSLKPVA